MKLEIAFQKTYPGQMPRPSIQVLGAGAGTGIAVFVPWGGGEVIRKACENMLEYFSTALVDRDATSPFAKMPGLSPTANYLRTSVILANDSLYLTGNKEAYNSGCELWVAGINDRELTWIQVGQPHMLLLRNKRMIPIQVATDLNVDYPANVPLPAKLLGIDKQLEFETKSLLLRPDDKIILLTRNTLPTNFFTYDFKQTAVEEVGQKLFDLTVAHGADDPFWLGILNF